MRYITGVYALNLPSTDGTPGDWHFSANGLIIKT